MADMSSIERLVSLVEEQQRQIHALSEKLKEVNIGAGGGNASVADYVSGETYKRNNIVVDRETETCYRVLVPEYIADTVEHDCQTVYFLLTEQPEDWVPEKYYKETTPGVYVHGQAGDPWAPNTWYDYTAMLKLLAAEGQVLGMSHDLTQEQINNLPEGAIVAIYSTSGSTYNPL